MSILTVKNPLEFAKAIEELVWNHDIEYIDAIVLYCEKHNIEIETAASLIKLNSNIKSKVQGEAETLNYLPKRSRLPIA
jgi:Phage late-transcription coactivator